MGLYADREDSLTFKFVNDEETNTLYTFANIVSKLLMETKKIGLLKKVLDKEEIGLVKELAAILIQHGVLQIEESQLPDAQ